MKVGDLVKYKDRWKETIGIIVEFKSVYSSGGGGAWPRSKVHVCVSWSSDKGTWISNERPNDLEVINKAEEVI